MVNSHYRTKRIFVKISFKEVVNQAIRKGLQADKLPVNNSAVVTRPHSFGTRSGLDWGRLNQPADELEVAAIEKSIRSML